MTGTSKSPSPRWLKIYGLILLAVLLIWLPVEDISEGLVLAYAAAVCTWGALRFMAGMQTKPGSLWLRHMLVYGYAGLAITPTALLLMAFKTGLHGHDTPDFTPHQMARVVEMTPLWLSIGLLVGIGTGLWMTAKSK